MLLTGADIVLACLAEQGVDTVFGYPGARILPLYDALARKENRTLQHILMTHEEHAAFAAEGYARATGKTGVVWATSGPGATNLVTGLANAYMDSTPLVAITCNVPLGLLGKDSFQEVDIAGITMPITKYNTIVKNVRQLADTLRAAFHIAASGRPGPVLVDIPQDVAEASCAYEREAPKPILPILQADELDFESAAQLIAESKQPMIYAGGGVVQAGASEELCKLAERLNAPVTLSLMGIGAFPASHPNYTGLIGMFGSQATRACLAETDLLIAIGARFSERSFSGDNQLAPGAKVLHIDVDPAEINKNIPASLSLIGDAKAVLKKLLPRVAEKASNPLLEVAARFPAPTVSSADLTAETVVATLGRLAPPGQIYTTEVGQHQLFAAKHLSIQTPRSFLTAGGLGAMGFGFSAAIGASLATGKKIINIAGDGSFYMNLAELSTAVNYHLPIVNIILNNRVLGMVRQVQSQVYASRYFAVDLDRQTDIPALARALGAKSWQVTQKSGLEETLSQALACEGPAVVECIVPKDEEVSPSSTPCAAP